jgi:hypothetical protein
MKMDLCRRREVEGTEQKLCSVSLNEYINRLPHQAHLFKGEWRVKVDRNSAVAVM